MRVQHTADDETKPDEQRQFQFFKIENALQQVVENLIEPMKRRMMEVEDKNNKTKDYLSKLKGTVSANVASILDMKNRILEIGTCMRQI